MRKKCICTCSARSLQLTSTTRWTIGLQTADQKSFKSLLQLAELHVFSLFVTINSCPTCVFKSLFFSSVIDIIPVKVHAYICSTLLLQSAVTAASDLNQFYKQLTTKHSKYTQTLVWNRRTLKETANHGVANGIFLQL